MGCVDYLLAMYVCCCPVSSNIWVVCAQTFHSEMYFVFISSNPIAWSVFCKRTEFVALGPGREQLVAQSPQKHIRCTSF